MKQYSWTQITKTPKEAGVYAWYYKPELTEYDIKQAILKIEYFLRKDDTTSAKGFVNDFFENFLFNRFIEDPYEILMRGALKPRYEGEVKHMPTISKTLVERIAQSPDRLKTVKTVLENSAPLFASPIYIGMADNLRDRLCRHKKLIEKYNKDKSKSYIFSKSFNMDNKMGRDQSFAWQVCKRNIAPTNLFVVTSIVNADEKQYIDIENILNRIHYPLFGRN